MLIAILYCSAVLNTELLRIHSSFEHGLPKSTKTTICYGVFRIPLAATRRNEVYISSASSFSSFFEKKEAYKIFGDEICIKVMIICVFYFCFLNILHFVFFSVIREIFNVRPSRDHTFI